MHDAIGRPALQERKLDSASAIDQQKFSTPTEKFAREFKNSFVGLRRGLHYYFFLCGSPTSARSNESSVGAGFSVFMLRGSHARDGPGKTQGPLHGFLSK